MSESIPATLIAGDGIGPEIMESVVAALDALGAPFQWERRAAGLARTGDLGGKATAAEFTKALISRIAHA
jgi:isocitrate dehydrogenase (NAD+)